MFEKKVQKTQEKVLDIKAGMKGNVKFDSPINLKISGKFEGALETKGHLFIGETAEVKAKTIKGENIVISGRVKGDIMCTGRLEVSPPASVIGNIRTPILVVNAGSTLKGHCEVPAEDKISKDKAPRQSFKFKKKKK